VITRDLRHAIARAVAAAGFPPGDDPGLRPAGAPGQYAASVAFALDRKDPKRIAQTLAKLLSQEQWISAADVTGVGYLTVTVTDESLRAVADTVIAAGQACVASDALRGKAAPPALAGDPLAAATWEQARAALAARLTARLAAAAGATVVDLPDKERSVVSLQVNSAAPSAETTGRYADITAAVGYAGRDAVTFTLARAIPGRLLWVAPKVIARHVLGNPAYAVRYAHARAASGVRWAVASATADTIGVGEVPLLPGPDRRDIRGSGGSSPRVMTEGDRQLLNALSWLPERVATAARRGRPDEFARYLEDLASVTIDVLSSPSHPGTGVAPGSGRLTLAKAAQTGLAAGLGLLDVTAPERL